MPLHGEPEIIKAGSSISPNGATKTSKTKITAIY